MDPHASNVLPSARSEFSVLQKSRASPKLSTNCTGRPTDLVGIVQDNNKVDDSLYKVLGR